MKWHRYRVMKSFKTEGVLIEDIAEGLELEKSFFIHQIVHSIYPFGNRRNRFEGVMKNGEFQIFGERLILGIFMPFIITVKGKIESEGEGSRLEIKGNYSVIGKYFSIANVLTAIALLIVMIFQKEFNGLPILFALNAGISAYIFPMWGGWNFKKVEKEITRIITEHNN
jgi:hypothetical protein